MDMNSTVTPSVALAVEQIKLNFPACDLQVTPDGNGGGWFMLQTVALGEPYVNELIWMGGDLSAQLPYALYDEGPSLEDCDLIATSIPLSLAKKSHILLTEKARNLDQDLLDGLRRVG